MKDYVHARILEAVQKENHNELLESINISIEFLTEATKPSLRIGSDVQCNDDSWEKRRTHGNCAFKGGMRPEYHAGAIRVSDPTGSYDIEHDSTGLRRLTSTDYENPYAQSNDRVVQPTSYMFKQKEVPEGTKIKKGSKVYNFDGRKWMDNETGKSVLDKTTTDMLNLKAQAHYGIETPTASRQDFDYEDLNTNSTVHNPNDIKDTESSERTSSDIERSEKVTADKDDQVEVLDPKPIRPMQARSTMQKIENLFTGKYRASKKEVQELQDLMRQQFNVDIQSKKFQNNTRQFGTAGSTLIAIAEEQQANERNIKKMSTLAKNMTSSNVKALQKAIRDDIESMKNNYKAASSEEKAILARRINTAKKATETSTFNKIFSGIAKGSIAAGSLLLSLLKALDKSNTQRKRYKNSNRKSKRR
ncbi:hypothetical protein [Endozoicomonas sp. SCSIO W0465]|uniref:hypothetical protein n=1 Tax=Endozoicomonas sp. SCSIO W0465 TaxID=2918516 RepID=UPI002075533B|nr:hypothetical protein [Endozoicomonas sp. SCSIO W0465]USE39543.1 hypothetical protein MJO57_16075 [Endozoicomonas sp. SCSIO W0465]